MIYIILAFAILFGILSAVFYLLLKRALVKASIGNQAFFDQYTNSLSALITNQSSLFEKQIRLFSDNVTQQINQSQTSQLNHLEVMQRQLTQISELNESKIENMRKFFEERTSKTQVEITKKLDEIRVTVDEKLHSTLEKRLSESFKIVSTQLEMVYKGLGEMQNLASGVGDLKKVLTNVKVRGIWGEIQLGSMLSQIFSKEQYKENVLTNSASDQRVEFAIKLPSNNTKSSEILLPIDSKFPLSEYQKLVDLYEENSNKAQVEKQIKALENVVKKEAKAISEKYINPPNTTDFAIMFLPIEALYAEISRIPNLLEILQRDYRVIITSPTTLMALLNSLQMGFRAFAIEKRSVEIWKLLGKVKHDFSGFMTLLGKTKTKLEQASKVIGEAEYKGKVITSKLEDVEKISIESHE